MSSESEDEFESADEGSDFEDTESSTTSHLKANIDHSPVIEDTLSDSPPNESRHGNDGSTVCTSTTAAGDQETEEPEQMKECSAGEADVIGPTSDSHQTPEDPDSSYVTNVSVKTERESGKSEDGSTEDAKKDVTTTEKSKTMLSVEAERDRTDEQDSLEKPQKPQEKITKEESQEESVTEEKITKDSVTKQVKHSSKSLEEAMTEQMNISETTGRTKQSEKVRELGKTDTKGIKQDDKATNQSEDRGKNLEAEKETSSISGAPKPRPIRESKIGMKKPREKLGERLGAKKLGTRIEKKSEIVTSDDSSKSEDFPSKGGDGIPKTSALDMKQKREEHRQAVNDETDEERRQLQQQKWEKEQERWQQAFQKNSKQKEVSYCST